MIDSVIVNETLKDGSKLERKLEDVLGIAVWYKEDVIELADYHELEIDENDEEFWKTISEYVENDFPPTEEDMVETIKYVLGE